ncbi:cell death abnormality protein 1-like, partial [Ruditapes philippinarum]|uniref:cell death abnormality protein 1-like n=1 Tax=Ruditapes philippinarum TaxID=129788 RepID=UPI00295B07EB
LNDGCSADNECTDVENAECGTGGKCTCKDTHKPHATDGTCEPKGLNDGCSADSECATVENAECGTGGKCTCKDTHKPHATDGTCEPKVVGSTCSGSEACPGDENTICNNNKCECKEDFAEKNDVCTLTVSGKDCSDTSKCEIDNAVCDTETSKCKCDADFTMNVDKCDPKNAAAMTGFGAIVFLLSVLSACLMMF